MSDHYSTNHSNNGSNDVTQMSVILASIPCGPRTTNQLKIVYSWTEKYNKSNKIMEWTISFSLKQYIVSCKSNMALREL
jgi:hypothetical protein